MRCYLNVDLQREPESLVSAELSQSLNWLLSPDKHCTRNTNKPECSCCQTHFTGSEHTINNHDQFYCKFNLLR